VFSDGVAFLFLPKKKRKLRDFALLRRPRESQRASTRPSCIYTLFSPTALERNVQRVLDELQEPPQLQRHRARGGRMKCVEPDPGMGT
jgi:hypothetical protein